MAKRQLDHYADAPVDTFYLAREGDGLNPYPWIKPVHHPENQVTPAKRTRTLTIP
jgi:hypothetical protein